jgi:RNA polymerase sigma factor (sigma-70 family)
VDPIPVFRNERALWLATHVLPLEPTLRAWLVRMVPAGLELDDVIQEVYAKLWSLPSIEHIHQPKPYVFQIVRNLVLEHIRHAHVVEIDAVAELDELDISMEEASVERIVSGREELARVYEAILALPQRCREVFVMRKLEGLSQREIAARLRVSESTVEKHIGRALRFLTRQLEEGTASRTRTQKLSNVKGSRHGEP